MLLTVQILLASFTLLFGLGVIGEKEKDKVPYYAGIAAVSIVALTVTLLF